MGSRVGELSLRGVASDASDDAGRRGVADDDAAALAALLAAAGAARPRHSETDPGPDAHQRLAIAGAVVAAVAAAGGWSVPGDLLVSSAVATATRADVEPLRCLDVPTRLAGPALLGSVYEATLLAADRMAGSHYTPSDVAAGVVGIATGLDPFPGSADGDDGHGAAADLRRVAGLSADLSSSGGGSVAGPDPLAWDPACGGGAFLLAVADALLRSGHDPATIVDELVWGTDIDAGAVAVAEAALAWWADLHGADRARPRGHLSVADALDGDVTLPEAGFALVVGNPPFQSQLTGRTVRSAGERRRLRARWGEVVGAYTDTAALFLVAGARALRPGGRLAMVVPTSLLASRDAAAARRTALHGNDLVGLWVAGEAVFDAAVDVCAPVLERRDEASEPLADRCATVRRWSGRRFRPLPAGGAPVASDDGAGPVATGGPEAAAAHPSGVGRSRASEVRGEAVPLSTSVVGDSWSPLALVALGVPDPIVRTRGRVGDLATAMAGFRDEYYGLVGHVHEAPAGLRDGGPAPLVTSGLIDVGRCAWGERPARFARERFERPVVDVDALASSARRSGDGDRALVRAAAWVSATAVPKVVVATQTRVGEAAVDEAGRWVASTPTVVLTAPPDKLWALAAVVCSPVGTVAALAAVAGSGRSAGAIRHSVSSVLGLPLPVDVETWWSAAAALRAGDRREFVESMAVAYAVEGAEELHEWWYRRAPA